MNILCAVAVVYSLLIGNNKFALLQVKEFEAELEELRSTLESMKESLEAETLSKVDLQNSIQSLREELAFRKKVYEEVREVLEEIKYEEYVEERNVDISVWRGGDVHMCVWRYSVFIHGYK